MKTTLVIAIAMITTPAIAQTTYGNSNCYIAGSNVSCTGQTQTIPAPQQRQRPAYQDMMAAQLQQSQDDWRVVAQMAARERLCRKAAAVGDTVYLNVNCR